MSSLGDIRVDVKFNADVATASIDNVQLTISELLVYYYEITDS